jgi:purine-nucleoside/S-methyl-5'-thioadenosine phosphorylase / adenosine deaminase
MPEILEIIRNAADLRRGVFPALQSIPRLVHLLTTEDGPDLRPDPSGQQHADAMATLAAEMGLSGVAWARQVHGDQVKSVTTGGFQGDADALICGTPGVGVAVRGADCPLILIAGRDAQNKPLWAAVHASWRCTVAGLTTKTLAIMHRDHAARLETMTAAICPSAGPCCYEVGREVQVEAQGRLGSAAAKFFIERDRRLLFDMWAANRTQLIEAGLNAPDIWVAGCCTICGDALFPGYRKDGSAAGRYAAVLGVRS